MEMRRYVSIIGIILITIILFGCSFNYDEIDNKDYYVSKEGDDKNPGTFDEPWQTIQKAAESLKAGETVLIREGIYREEVLLKNSGEAGSHIVFKSYKDEKVILDGKDIDWGYNWSSLFDINAQSYIRIEGIRVENSRWAGFGSTTDGAGSSHVEIRNCSTYNTQASGIIFMNADNIIIDSNAIERASINTSGSQEGISLDNVDYFEVSDNKVFDFTNQAPGRGGEGIDAKNGSSYGKIHGNEVYSIPKIGIYIDSYEGEQKDIEIYDNNIYACGQGITLANEKGGYLKNVVVRNNTIENCNWGLTVGGWDEGYTHEMESITFMENELAEIKVTGIYLNNPDARNVSVKGNIIQGRLSYIPIKLNGGNLDETVIDGNYFDKLVEGQPVGTNYKMLE